MVAPTVGHGPLDPQRSAGDGHQAGGLDTRDCCGLVVVAVVATDPDRADRAAIGVSHENTARHRAMGKGRAEAVEAGLVSGLCHRSGQVSSGNADALVLAGGQAHFERSRRGRVPADRQRLTA